MNKILKIFAMACAMLAAPACGMAAAAHAPADSIDNIENTDSIVLPPATFATAMELLHDGRWVLRKGSTIALRAALKLGIDYTLKHTVHEMRPDRSSNNSFPSRHSSWAYGIAGSVAYYMAPYSPFWGVGSHTIANAIGMQRVMARRHWAGDVMAGAGIGLSTDLFSWAFANWIWGRDDVYQYWRSCPNEFMPSLSMSTGAALPMTGAFGDYQPCTALVSTARFTLPLGNRWGFAADLSMASMPLKHAKGPTRPLNSASVLVGASAHQSLGGGPFAIAGYAQAGYCYYFSGIPSADYGRHGIAARLAVQATMMLTRKFSVGTEAAYSASTLSLGGRSAAYQAITLSFLTRAAF